MLCQNQPARDYSRIEHISKAIFFSQWDNSYMAIFTAYFDVSGHPDSTDVLSVAGFIANTGQWTRFEKEWKKVLANYGVLSLHMRSFAHSTEEFTSWKGDEDKRRAFLSALINVLVPRVRHSFVSSVYLPDYRAIDKVNSIRSLRSPFALAGCTCIGKVMDWATAKGFDTSKLAFVFEDGDEDKLNFAQCAFHDFNVNPIFLNKAQSVAFQAADLLAYEHLKANIKIIPNSGLYALEDLRKPLQTLDTIPHGANGEDWGIHEKPQMKDGFKKLFAHLGQPWV
jgi:hypothetical protein